MAQQHFDRLTALDASFLAQEGGICQLAAQSRYLAGDALNLARVH